MGFPSHNLLIWYSQESWQYRKPCRGSGCHWLPFLCNDSEFKQFKVALTLAWIPTELSGIELEKIYGLTCLWKGTQEILNRRLLQNCYVRDKHATRLVLPPFCTQSLFCFPGLLEAEGKIWPPIYLSPLDLGAIIDALLKHCTFSA